MIRRFLVLFGALTLMAGAYAKTVTVYIYNFNFTTDQTLQRVITPVIKVGDKIHWVNVNGFHCTNSCTGLQESWASGSMGNGATFDHTFTHAGVYNYYCCIHGSDNGNGTYTGMGGRIIVIKPIFIKPSHFGMIGAAGFALTQAKEALSSHIEFTAPVAATKPMADCCGAGGSK